MSRPAVPMTIASSSSQSSAFETVGSVDRLARPDDRRRRLDEQLRHDLRLVDALSPALLDVGLEVAGDREQLARPADRREQLDRRERLAAAGVGRGARGVEGRGPAWSSASRSPRTGRRSTVDDRLVAGIADDRADAGLAVGTAERGKAHGRSSSWIVLGG